jgi:hypothetical protein
VPGKLRPRHKQSRHPLFEGGGLRLFDQFLQIDLGRRLIKGNAAVVFNIGQTTGNLFELLVADDFGIHWNKFVAHRRKEGWFWTEAELQVDLGRRLVKGNAAVVFDIGQAPGNFFELFVADDVGALRSD